MSYILDALKKAEQKRRQGAFPNLLSVHEQTGFKARKPARWPYILISILLVSIGALLPRLYEKYSGAQNRGGVSVTAAPQEGAPSVAVTPLRSTAAVHNDRTPDAIQQTTPAHEPIGQQTRGKSEEKSVNLVSTKRKAETAPINAPVSAAVTSLPKMGPSSKRITLKRITLKESDLPPAIQQELPKVVISAHIYDSNPSSRMIFIQGSAVHEGDNVAAGLRLESIIPEGVILSYKGYRFYKPLF